MIVVGVIKYGERTWTLWSASSDSLRDSMLTEPDPGPNYSKLADEYNLRHAEGFCVEIEKLKDEKKEDQIKKESLADAAKDGNEIMIAHQLFGTFKRLFADLILGFEDRDRSLSAFENLKGVKAFEVIAIELGFMYDLLYTKAGVVYTRWGLTSRAFTTLLTVIVLGIFCRMKKQQFSKVDVFITYMLLGVAVLLEIYATLMIFSDKFKWWLLKYKTNSMVKTIDPTTLFVIPRWSNCMAQYSIISVCLKEKPSNRILRRLHKLGEKHRYKTYVVVTDDLKEAIFKHVFNKYTKREFKSSMRELINGVLKDYNVDWSNEIEFDNSILIWHIVTDLCYYSSNKRYPNKKHCKMSKNLSDYMLYLLVMYPFLLPVGIGLIRFRDTEYEARNFVRERMSIFSRNEASAGETSRDKRDKRSIVCNMLLKVKTHVPPIKVKGDRSKSVLFDACKLATVLSTKIENESKKWEIIKDVWLEILTYAACKSRGSQHARQLRRGGELLTHVWLLMSHFGLTEQFQISQGHARARLTVK